MKYDYIGVELLKIAAFLYVARFIAAAIYMGPGTKSWSEALFSNAYRYIGNELTVTASITGLVGLISLIVAASKNSKA